MEERFVYVLILCIVIYIIGAVVSINVINISIRQYIEKSHGIVSRKMVRILDHNKDLFIIFGCVLFPLYYCFRFGFFVGRIVCELLIDDNYEDRIASWVV